MQSKCRDRRCSECRSRFTSDVRSGARQVTCGARKCRLGRRAKQARERRRRVEDRAASREEERLRKRDWRAANADKPRKRPLEVADPRCCPEPPCCGKCRELLKEIADFWDQRSRLSVAAFERKFITILGRSSRNLGEEGSPGGDLSVTAISVQPIVMTDESSEKWAAVSRAAIGPAPGS